MTRRNRLATIFALLSLAASVATLLLTIKKKREEVDQFVDEYDECDYDDLYKEFESSDESTEDITVPPITEE